VITFCARSTRRRCVRAAWRTRTSCAGSPSKLRHDGPVRRIQHVLENLWTSRVTSHVAAQGRGPTCSLRKAVAEAIGMLSDALKRAGNAAPAHRRVRTQTRTNGDNGNFGREEIDNHRAGRQGLRPSRGHPRRRALLRRHDLRAREEWRLSTAS